MGLADQLRETSVGAQHSEATREEVASYFVEDTARVLFHRFSKECERKSKEGQTYHKSSMAINSPVRRGRSDFYSQIEVVSWLWYESNYMWSDSDDTRYRTVIFDHELEALYPNDSHCDPHKTAYKGFCEYKEPIIAKINAQLKAEGFRSYSCGIRSEPDGFLKRKDCLVIEAEW